MADLAAWRALVDKELAGGSFDKLVHKTPEGIAIEPLYAERPPELAGARSGPDVFAVCPWVDTYEQAMEELDNGAGAVWSDDFELIEEVERLGRRIVADDGALISVMEYEACDAAEQIAIALSRLVELLRSERMAMMFRKPWVRIAVGRDTFGELCKLRALRACWHKVMAAAGDPVPGLEIHAVCSMQTMTARDPWVNMLRVTTQIFAAALGGAHLVTPQPFDAALVEHSELARRIARNTALVLREESQLGRVMDPAGGSYYIETRTDALAREAWKRFQAFEKAGGVSKLEETGELATRHEAAWAVRMAAIAKRKEPILGVSEFANPDEKLPSEPGEPLGQRDAEAFEALRAQVEAAPRTVSLVTLGPPAEHRGRVGFAEGFFAVAGVRTKIEAATDVAVLCGSDERYAAEAASTAKALKAAGAKRVVLAGKPAGYEGVDSYIYMGCDVLATLTEVLS